MMHASALVGPASLNELFRSGRLPIIRSAEFRNTLARLPSEDREFQVLIGQLEIQQSQIVDAVSQRVDWVNNESGGIEGFYFSSDDNDRSFFRQLGYAIYLNRTNRLF